MNEFEYIDHCSAKMQDRHDVCLNCIYAMIKQSEEFLAFLLKILRDDNYDFNDHCIEVIVSFVVGECGKIISNTFTKLE